MPPHPQLALRPKAAAEALSISERHLYELTQKGVIPCVRMGDGSRTKLYSVEALQDWLAGRPRRQADNTRSDAIQP